MHPMGYVIGQLIDSHQPGSLTFRRRFRPRVGRRPGPGHTAPLPAARRTASASRPRVRLSGA